MCFVNVGPDDQEKGGNLLCMLYVVDPFSIYFLFYECGRRVGTGVQGPLCESNFFLVRSTIFYPLGHIFRLAIPDLLDLVSRLTGIVHLTQD